MQPSDLLSRVKVIGLPTRTNFRGVSLREIALIKGEKRWSEFSPFKDYSVERDALWLQAALESANQDFPDPVRQQVRVNATLPEVPIEQVGEVLSWFPGSTTIKVKVGTANDEERIREVFRIVPEARLRLDANGLFSIHEAQEFLTSLYNKYGHHIEYVEQPCASLSENEALTIPIPLAIDENLRLGEDLGEINRIADVVIVKVAPLGGITRALNVISKLEKPVVISSALESSVGLTTGIALAAHLADDVICGLGTAALLDSDVVKDPLLPQNGFVSVTEVEIDDAALARFQLPQEQLEWWHNRIANAYAKYLENIDRGESR
ncbi:MAG: o-succinylbenzoate synthase [Actinomycetota bacterium]